MSPGLVERVDADVHVRVLAQNLLRVFVCVERVHEHQRHVRRVRFVQVLKTQQKSKRFKTTASIKKISACCSLIIGYYNELSN